MKQLVACGPGYADNLHRGSIYVAYLRPTCHRILKEITGKNASEKWYILGALRYAYCRPLSTMSAGRKEWRLETLGPKPCRITSAGHVEVTVQGGQFKTYDAIKAICVIKLPGFLPSSSPNLQAAERKLGGSCNPETQVGLGIESTINTTKLGDIPSFLIQYHSMSCSLYL